MPSGFCSISSLAWVWYLVLLLPSGTGYSALAMPVPAAVVQHAVMPEGRHAAPDTMHRDERLQQEALAPATTDCSPIGTGCPPALPWQLLHDAPASHAPAAVSGRPSAPAEPRLLQARRLLLALTPNAP